MKNEIEQISLNEGYLKNKIYIIRGQKVMLDSDLAIIYGYSTKAFNQQVQRNIDKFEKDFMFQLTKEEIPFSIRSQFVTGWHRNDRFKPFVFTEQGIYMLMTVLKGDLAIKQSKSLIRLFKKMKDYIVKNRELLPSKELELRTSLLEKDVKDINNHLNNVDNSLDKVMDNFIDPSTYKHFLILDGMKLEADIAYKKIFRMARRSIIYIDDYVNLKTLSILSLAKSNIDITLITDNKAKDKITSFMINDFNTQNKTNKLIILKNNNKCHDRFIILDFNTKSEKIYHCGASLKDAGNKITAINELCSTKEYKKTIKGMLRSPILTLI